MGDMADYDLDQILFPDDDPSWEEEGADEEAEREAGSQPEATHLIEPIRKQSGGEPVNLKSLIYDTEAVIAQLADLKDGEMDEDGDFETAMHFLVPSLLESRPNDLVRILWDRAVKRSEEARIKNPAREFQLLLQEFDLSLSRRM